MNNTRIHAHTYKDTTNGIIVYFLTNRITKPRDREQQQKKRALACTYQYILIYFMLL